MGFDRDRNNGGRSNDRSFSNDRNFSNNRNNGGRSGQSGMQSNGRIDNFEKPLIQLLKDINDKLEILINNQKEG